MLPLALALALAAGGEGAPASPPALAPVAPAPAAGLAPPPAPPALVTAAPPASPAPQASAAAPAASPPGAPASAVLAPAGAPAAPGAGLEAPPPPLPQAAVEKLGQGDRAFLQRDYRSALFAYQDAAYLAPESPLPRVRVARAYLALRYPAQAVQQAERALAADPANAEARRVLEEARRPRPALAQPVAAEAPPGAAPAPHEAARPEARPLVFRFRPEEDPSPSGAAPAPGSAPPGGSLAGVRGGGAPAVAASEAAPAKVPAAARVEAPPAASAAQRYRDAIALLAGRDYEGAAAALGEALELDPRLAVAHAARGSARVGLGRHREAAEDYRAALALDPGLATPLYGLAECHRALGDARAAADLYQRYAQSRSPDVREELRALAAKRAQELRP